MKPQNRKNGFTMVEILIYVGITGMVLTSFTGFLLSVSSIKSKAGSAAEVQANLRDSLNFIVQTVRKSSAISSPAAGSADQALILDDGLGNQLSFNVLENAINYSEGALPPELITSDKVAVDNIEFSTIGSDSVRIRLDMSYRYPFSRDYEFSQSMETTVSLR